MIAANIPNRVVLFATTLALAAAPIAAAAAASAEGCSAAKVKALGKSARLALKCHARAAKRDVPVDAECVDKAYDKLDASFAKSEARGGCLTVADAGAAGATADELVTDVVGALPHGPDVASRVCAARKRGEAGKKAKGFATCYSKAAKRATLVDAACLAKSDARFDQGFAAAEAPGGCQTTMDAPAVSAEVDEFAAAAVAMLVALCGDDIAGPGEQCDGAADAACPGECLVACVSAGECGDGVAEAPVEECDDGNTDGGDGCSATCTLENASALCAGVASTAGTAIASVVVASGLDRPVHLTAPPLDPHRLFVVEQEGIIRIIDDGVLLPTPFLDITAKVAGPSTSNERGLLSLAFHPDYESNGRFFVNYTRSGAGAAEGDTVIARYQVSANPDVADAGSEQILIVIDQFAGNHNGGQLAFDSAGRLWTGMGDGGGGGDPQENGQDDTRLLAKMLRFDVDVEAPPYYAVPADNPNPGAGDPLGLIWAKGVRNPWRFSFDRANGDLYIGDVGQNQIEEISYAPGSSGGGENYGWDIFEGSSCYEPAPAPDCPDPPTGFTFPITEYGHGAGCSVTGGFVYRGCALPDVHGTYFYADFCTNFVRTLEVVGGMATNEGNATAAFGGVSGISSFGEDARGELYVLGFDGTVRRMVPDGP